MTMILYLTRHAEAEHNVDLDYSIPDAPLTQHGREQAARLNGLTMQTIQQTAELIVTSPLTRTLQTTVISFPTLRARLEAQTEPKGIIVLSRLQEVNDHPCISYRSSHVRARSQQVYTGDTGRSRKELERVEEFSGIDFSPLEDDWNSKKGEFDSKLATERAKWVRRWLRARPEKELVGD
jgi:bisphosphoglycerate-dependent phosphoglycerate mutase